MVTNDIRNLLVDMRDAFANVVTNYSTLHHYVVERYGEADLDPLAYLSKGRGSSHTQRTTYDLDGDFWGAWHALHDVLEAYDAESDEIAQIVYEEALADGEPWAEEAYEYRQGMESDYP